MKIHCLIENISLLFYNVIFAIQANSLFFYPNYCPTSKFIVDMTNLLPG